MRKRKNKYLLLLLILGISIGFAYIAVQLNIIGDAGVLGNRWNVHFDNVVVLDGSVEGVETPSISEDKTKVNFSVDLDDPGDNLTFTVDAVNGGTLDAKITNLAITTYNGEGEEINLPDSIEYSVTYSNGEALANNQLLRGGSSLTYLVVVKYSEDAFVEQDESYRFELTLDYTIDDGTGVAVRSVTCKRADPNQLHTEACGADVTWGSVGCNTNGGYALNDKITYGNTDVRKGTLNLGDAFTCDVNGDGIYDEETERFYYVSAYYDTNNDTFDSNVATLIYYSNVLNGQPTDSTDPWTDGSSYIEDYSQYAPSGAYVSLPSTSDWPNVSLIDMSRQIRNHNGSIVSNLGDTLPIFKYEDKAARLLTTQEVAKSCGIYSFDEWWNNIQITNPACEFLFEKSGYSSMSFYSDYYWLETSVADASYSFWTITGSGNGLYANSWGRSFTRPVIDVPIDNMEY